MLAAALRKLGLGRHVYKILDAVLPHRAESMDTEEALRLLSAARPDCRSSGIAAAVPARNHANEEGIDLDIIIAVYNSEKYLRACLDSILNQDIGCKYRIIAVDDGSTDASADILKEYESTGKVLAHYQKNGGVAAARNSGLRLSTAEYIFYIDSDDLLYPGAIKALMACAAENRADIVEGSYILADNSGKPVRAVTHRQDWLRPTEECWGFACGLLMRASVLEGLRFPEGYRYEDSVMTQLVFPWAAKRGIGVYGLDFPVFIYRNNPVGVTRSGSANNKSLDALWIHMQLYRDRAALGIENDQEYYEYMLRMLALTYRRTARQPEEMKRAVFVVFADFLRREFSQFKTKNSLNRYLEAAAATGDYNRYKLLCSLCRI